MTATVDSRLAIQGQAMTYIAIVEAGIEEVAALRIMPAIELAGIGVQFTVQMAVESVDAQVEAAGLVSQATSRLQHMQVVFLLHLRFRAVVAVAENRGSRRVLVQCGVHPTIGYKGRQLQVSAQTKCHCGSLQITVGA